MTDQIQNYIQEYFQMAREGLINPERHIDTFEMSDYLRQKYSLKASDHAVFYIF